MLLKLTVLDDLYTNGTHLADGKADKHLLKEFEDISFGLIDEKSNVEYETGFLCNCLTLGLVKSVWEIVIFRLGVYILIV